MQKPVRNSRTRINVRQNHAGMVDSENVKGTLSPSGMVRSEHYAETMENTVLPYNKAHENVREIAGADGKSLYTCCYMADMPRATVVIVHGFTENAFKYSEIIHSLLRNGYNVLIYDQRGHGRSWRDPAVKGTDLTHVERFEEYVEDLEHVLACMLPELTKPYYLFSHSMGGAVSALYLEKGGEVFSKAILSSPMIAPATGGIPAAVCRTLCQGARMAGRGREKVFISSGYTGPEDFETSCTTGRERFGWYDQKRQEEVLFRNSSPTYGWTAESLAVTGKILKPGAVENIRIPVRVYSAELDGTVLNPPQKVFAGRLRHGSIETVEGAKHEIYRSTDEVVFAWWDSVLRYFES